jgi:hypothetical protein
MSSCRKGIAFQKVKSAHIDLINSTYGSWPLSVAIITNNEEYRLVACLESVSFAAEIIVVDSGSTDMTVEIAKRFGAEVYHESWRGFGRQKQSAINHCTQPWILVLDADERVTSELAVEIQTVITSSPSCCSFRIPRKNLFCGRWLKHAGWWPDRVVRLFRKGSARMSDRLVHESLMVDGNVAELRFPLLHYTNRDLRQTLEKINLYSSAGAEELHKRGVSASLSMAMTHTAWSFVNNYVIRLGMLDGGPGLVQAMTDAVNTLFKYLKLWEMGQPSDNQSSRFFSSKDES